MIYKQEMKIVTNQCVYNSVNGTKSTTTLANMVNLIARE